MLPPAHRRSHHDLAARANPFSLPGNGNGNNGNNGNPENSPPSSQELSTPSPNPTTPDLTPLTPSAPASRPTDTPTPSASAPTFSLPGLPSSSTSSSAPTSTSTSSTSASVSSLTTTRLTSTASTPLVAAPVTTARVPLGTSVASIAFTPTSSVHPSSTSTPSTSSGVNTGAIVGGVAGTLAGIAVLGFLLMWCMRRQRNRDVDDFDAQAFKRQSAMLVDDPVEPPQSYNPRPPSMIEHHNASPALAAQAGYGTQNVYGNYGAYGQQPLHPPEMVHPAGSPPPQAYGAPPMAYAGYNDPQHPVARQPSNMGYAGYNSVARQPSNAQYLTRQPSSTPGYAPATAPPAPLDGNSSYIDLRRSSVSPYQAAQYADISRQLGAADPNRQVPRDSRSLPDGPLPCPFDDPVRTAPASDPASSQAHMDPPSDPAVIVTHSQGNAVDPHHRPVTVYEEGDAYGGI